MIWVYTVHVWLLGGIASRKVKISLNRNPPPPFSSYLYLYFHPHCLLPELSGSWRNGSLSSAHSCSLLLCISRPLGQLSLAMHKTGAGNCCPKPELPFLSIHRLANTWGDLLHARSWDEHWNRQRKNSNSWSDTPPPRQCPGWGGVTLIHQLHK